MKFQKLNFFLYLLVTFYSFSLFSNPSKPIVLLLYGTSSAGKTSLLREVMKQASIPFLFFSGDSLVNNSLDKKFATLVTPSMTEEEKKWFYFFRVIDEAGNVSLHINQGEEASKLMQDFIDSLAMFAGKGHNLILDEVMWRPEEFERYKKAFSQVATVVCVKVYCQLEECMRREQARGDRFIGFARGLYCAYNNVPQCDIEVDTTSTPPQENAKKILAELEKYKKNNKAEQ